MIAEDGRAPVRPDGATLVVNGLSVAYQKPSGDEIIAVWRAGLTLEPGRITAVVGESGCGKSTLALAMIGYRPPRGRIVEGTSLLAGRDLLACSRNQLRSLWGDEVAYLAQSASGSLNPAIPVGRQIGQVLSRHLSLGSSESRHRVCSLLHDVDLTDPESALRRYPHEFSGGQLQRIALARALACNPRVMILDEPTTGLDVITQSHIGSLLRELVTRRRVATLYVSHDLAHVSSIADNLIVMYGGEVVESGAAGEVVGDPHHPYTRALLEATPSIHERCAVVATPGRPPSHAVVGKCAFAPRCAYAIAACSSAHVPLLPVAAGRSVRCIRSSEIGAWRVRARVSVSDSVSGVEIVPHAVPLLRTDDLWCRYPRASTAAVRGVSLTLRAGETLGVVGESGSGKSTLLRTIAGLHPQERGGVELGGIGLATTASRRPRSVRREIQIIFQNPDSSLNPRHTVRAILRRPIRLFRDEVAASDEPAAVDELLEAVRLPRRLMHRYPSELSGGQRQRVAIARAFAVHPSVLLCDEITSALDVLVQARIVELIGELGAAYGTAVVFVSHDLALVRTVAERAVVIKDGRVCEEDTTERLFHEPKHEYTRDLVAAVTSLADRALVRR